MKFTIKTTQREQIVDITEQIKQAIEGKEGKAVLIYVPHTSCSVLINENYDENVCEDILDFLKQQIPPGKWKHDKIDDNGDAHVKAGIIGPSQVIPMQGKNLQLGKWQNIGLVEFDGPRERVVEIVIL